MAEKKEKHDSHPDLKKKKKQRTHVEDFILLINQPDTQTDVLTGSKRENNTIPVGQRN